MRRKAGEGLTKRQRNVFIHSQEQIDKSAPNALKYYRKAREAKSIDEEMYWWTAVFHRPKKDSQRGSKRKTRLDPAYLILQEMYLRKIHTNRILYAGTGDDTYSMDDIVLTSDPVVIQEIDRYNKNHPTQPPILFHVKEDTPKHQLEPRYLMGFTCLVMDIVKRAENENIVKSLACYLVDLGLDSLLDETKPEGFGNLFNYMEEIYTLKSSGEYKKSSYLGNKYYMKLAREELQELIQNNILGDESENKS